MASNSGLRPSLLRCGLWIGTLLGSVSCARDRSDAAAGTPSPASSPAEIHASKAAEQLLADAFVAESELGDFRTFARYDLGNGNQRTVVRMVKVIDGFRCERFETTLSGRLAPTKTFVTLVTREGAWELYPDAAIRMVDQITQVRDGVIASIGREQLQPDRFRAGSREINGRRFTCITAYFSDQTRLAIAAQTAARMKDRGVTVSGALAATAQRREYLIDDELHIVTSLQHFSAAGTAIGETHIDRIESHLSLPAGLFSIPSQMRRYYPQTPQEFRSLATDAYIRAQTLSPRTTLGQNQTRNKQPGDPNETQ